VRAGFSLVELVIVLAVAAVLAAGATLAWSRTAAALTLDRAVHQLAADLRGAQTLARASARRTRIVVVRGTGGYRREHERAPGDWVVDATFGLPPRITVADANSGGALAFSARGDGENGTIVLVDVRGSRRGVRLNQRGRLTLLAAGES
jgi:prepilin-type N-terminal cleavage/methylation domain-containing protein